MEVIEIKRPVLGASNIYVEKILALAICILLFFLIAVSGIEIRKYPAPLFLVCFIGCVFLLFMVIKKILMIPKRTYLTINDDRIIIYDKREPGEICFNEVKTFECEIIRLWRFNIPTDGIIAHLKNGNGYVKTFSAAGITIKQQELCDILNERLNSYKRNEKKYPTR